VFEVEGLERWLLLYCSMRVVTILEKESRGGWIEVLGVDQFTYNFIVQIMNIL
jgi:hypothetical protein